MSKARPRGVVAFLQEAKRRKVYVSAVAYIGVTAVVVELTGAVSDALLFPDWTSRLVTFLLVLGFPVVLVLSWTFDITGKGVVRTGDLGEDDDAADGNGAMSRSGATGSRLAQGRGASTSPSTESRPWGKQTPLPALRRRRGMATAGGGTLGPGSGGNGTAASLAGEGKNGVKSGNGAAADTPAPDPERVRRATLAHMRHELRTPINGIIGYSEMLLEDVDDETFSGDLERIRLGGEKLLSLIDQVLGESAVRDSDRDLESYAEQIRVDLRTPVTSVVGYAEMLLETAQEEDRQDLVPDLERIRTSAHRLLELSGDIVGLATAGAEAAVVERSPASELTRSVLSKIQSAGDGEKEDAEGRLLVVDDNANNRDLLSRQLARQGYIVLTASDGQEALDLLESKTVDLILLDVIMPNLDGVETLRRLKSSERLHEIPVLMLSSLDEVDGALRCIELGAEDYLSKPVKPSILEARITANLELFRMRERERIYRERLEADGAFIENLLRSAFPEGVAARIRNGGGDLADVVPEATVLACRIRGLSEPSSSGDLRARLQGLKEICGRVEQLALSHGVETCIWRCDGFLAVAGAPTPTEDHLERAAALGQTFHEAVSGFSGPDGRPLRLSMGLHTGPVAAAALGGERLRYEVWGDGVKTAEAMADSAPDGALVASPTVYRGLKDRFSFEAQKVRDVAGVQMRTYLFASS